MRKLLVAVAVASVLSFAAGAVASRVDEWGTPDWSRVCLIQTGGGGVRAEVDITVPSADGGEPFAGTCARQLTGGQLTAAQSFAATRLAACAAEKRFQ